MVNYIFNQSKKYEMIKINCNLCDSKEYRVLRDNLKGKFIAVKCKNCGLEYINPIPFSVKEEAEDFYNELEYNLSFFNSLEKWEKLTLEEFSRQVNILKKIGLNKEKGIKRKFLDIGCGIGLYVKASQELGWEAVGLELDKKSTEYAINKWRLDIRRSLLEKANFKSETFDYIKVRYVFEHLPYPGRFLDQVSKILKKGGFIQIDVPNQNGLINRLKMFFGLKKTNEWGCLDPPFHLHAYTPKILKSFLEKSGLKIEYIKTTTPGDPTFRPTLPDKSIKGFFYKISFYLLRIFLQNTGMGSIIAVFAQK